MVTIGERPGVLASPTRGIQSTAVQSSTLQGASSSPVSGDAYAPQPQPQTLGFNQTPQNSSYNQWAQTAGDAVSDALTNYWEGSNDFDPDAEGVTDEQRTEYINRQRDLFNQLEGNPTIPGVEAIKGSSPMGAKLASAAQEVATRRNTVGKCYAGVAEAVDKAYGGKVSLTGLSAYMAAEQLARSSEFKEIKVSDLRSLPAGAIVVWRKADRSPHGHISVALGGGKEASDHVAPQMTNYRGDTLQAGGARVFVPKDMAINVNNDNLPQA